MSENFEYLDFEKDHITSDYQKVAELVREWRKQGLIIVLTSGSFDISHLGHSRYLMRAKECGDILIVGVDNDEKITARKGPNRPIVPEDERYAFLPHVRHVDLVVTKGKDDPEMHLIKTVRPDVLIISETTKHAKERIKKMQPFCGMVKKLPPQATTSTTARVRKLFVLGANEFADKLMEKINELLHEIAK